MGVAQLNPWGSFGLLSLAMAQDYRGGPLGCQPDSSYFSKFNSLPSKILYFSHRSSFRSALAVCASPEMPIGIFYPERLSERIFRASKKPPVSRGPSISFAGFAYADQKPPMPVIRTRTRHTTTRISEVRTAAHRPDTPAARSALPTKGPAIRCSSWFSWLMVAKLWAAAPGRVNGRRSPFCHAPVGTASPIVDPKEESCRSVSDSCYK